MMMIPILQVCSEESFGLYPSYLYSCVNFSLFFAAISVKPWNILKMKDYIIVKRMYLLVVVSVNTCITGIIVMNLMGVVYIKDIHI